MRVAKSGRKRYGSVRIVKTNGTPSRPSWSKSDATYPIWSPTQLETGASDASVTPIVWTTTAKRSAATPSAASAGRSELPTMSTDE